MKKITTILLLLAFTSVSAQDIIHKKDDDNIHAKIIEIGKTEIKYKKWKYQDGDTYTIPVSEVESIEYQDGTKITINPENSVKQNNVVTERPNANSNYPHNTPSQDKIYLHSGGVISGVVLQTTIYSVNFKYSGENVEKSISKYDVERIVYASGRTEKITDKVIVSSKDDWENVVILDNILETNGLTRVDDVSSKGGGAFVSANKAKDKSIERLKKEAAELHCQFVLISTTIRGWYSTATVEQGVAYRY